MQTPARERPAPARHGPTGTTATAGPEEPVAQESATELDFGRLARPGVMGAPPDDGGGGGPGSFDSRSKSRLALQLQRTVGNAATIRTLQRSPAHAVKAPAAAHPAPALPSREGADTSEGEAIGEAGGAPAGLVPRAAIDGGASHAIESEPLTGLGFDGLDLDLGSAGGNLGLDDLPLHDLGGLKGDILGAGAQHLTPTSAGAGGQAGPPIQRFPELKAPLADPTVEAPEAPEIDQAPQGGEAEGAAQAGESRVSGAGRTPSGGGLLETVINQAKNWVAGKVSQAAGAVGQVGSTLSNLFKGPLTSAFNFAKNVGSGIVSTIKSGVTKVWNGIKAPLKAIQQSVGGVVRNVIQTASKAIRPLTSKLGALVKGLLNTGGDIVGAITAQITGAISKIGAALAALPGRIVAGITSAITRITSGLRAMVTAVAQKLTQVVTRITTTVSSVMSRAANAVRSVLTRIEGFLRNIPSIIRSIVSSIVDAVLSTVRSVVDTITKTVADLLKKIGEKVTKVIDTFRKKVEQKIDAMTKAFVGLVNKFADLIKKGVDKAVKGVSAMIKGVKGAIQSILKRVLDPIKDVIAKKLAEWIGPKIQEALKQGGGLKKMMAGIPKRIAGAAQGVVDKVKDTAAITGHDVLRGLMRPDGDHFSFGVSVGVTGEAGVGAGVAVTGTADLVLDYASHEIGVFFSPGVTVGAGGGVEAEGGPNVDLTGSWGTVLSFGANRGAGVRAGFQGAFVGGGVSANAEAGARLGRSEGIYVGAAPLYDAAKPLGEAAAQGFNGGGPPAPPPPPPPPAPPTTIPVPPSPTPLAERLVTSQAVLFDTGKASIKPAGLGVIGNVLDSTAHAHTLTADATYRLASVGGASLRWRHPSAGQNADELNQALSVQRAQVVAGEVTRGLATRGLGGISQVQQDAMGSELGHVLNLPSDNNSPVFRATTLTSWEKPGAPPTPPPAPAPTGTGGGGPGGSGGGGGPTPAPTAQPGPGGPGSGPNTPSLAPGESNWFGDDREGKGIGSAIPNPLHGPLVPDLMHRPTMGWDSGVSLGLRAGVGVGAGASVNATFSIPIYSRGFPAGAEVPLRVVMGIVKLGLDLLTLNLQGGLRDGVGIVGAFVPPAIINGIADFVFPLPPGYTD